MEVKYMESGRELLFGIKLIAAFFFLKTAVLGGALVAAHLDSGIRAAALGLMGQLAPPLQLMRPDMILAVAPLFLILGAVIVNCVPKMRQIVVRHFSLNGEGRCRSNCDTRKNFRSARFGG
jgi:hypothetical protein